MNHQKIGAFLKELRRAKGVTQEQLAETLSVSRRTVSRWETGSNMPDLDILVEIADYYEVDIRELFDGERRPEHMDKDMKETALKMADYSNEEKQAYMKRLHGFYIMALIAFAVYFISTFFEPAAPSALFDFMQGLMLGICLAMIIVGILMTGESGKRLRKAKARLLGKGELLT